MGTALIEAFESRLLLSGGGITSGGARSTLLTIPQHPAYYTVGPIGTTGGSLVVFPQRDAASGYNVVEGQIVDDKGAAVGSLFPISATNEFVSNFVRPAVTYDPKTGNAFVAYGLSPSGIELAAVSPTGSILFNKINVLGSPSGQQDTPAIAFNPAGGGSLGVGFLNTLTGGKAAEQWFGTFAPTTGAPILPPVQISASPSPLPPGGVSNTVQAIAPLASGAFQTVWYTELRDKNFQAQDQELFGSVVSAAGAGLPVKLFEDPLISDVVGTPRIVPTADGSFIAFSQAVYTTVDQATFNYNYDYTHILGLKIGPDGNAVGGTTVLLTAQPPTLASVSDLQSFTANDSTGTPHNYVACICPEGASGTNPLVVTSAQCVLFDPPTNTINSTNLIGNFSSDVRIRLNSSSVSSAVLISTTSASSAAATSTDIFVEPATVKIAVPVVLPALSIADDSGVDVENYSDTPSALQFKLTLSTPATAQIVVRVHTLDKDASTTAKPGSDYTPVDTMVTFEVGSSQRVVSVRGGVTEAEVNKTFKVGVSIESGDATIARDTATGQLSHKISTIGALYLNIFFGGGRATAPGGSVAGTVEVSKPASASAPLPKTGSGKLDFTLDLPGGKEVVLPSVAVPIDLSKKSSQKAAFKFKLPTPFASGSFPLRVKFTPDAKSAIKAANIDTHVSSAAGSLLQLTVVNTVTASAPLVVADPDGTLASVTVSGKGSGEIKDNGDGTDDLVLTGTGSGTSVTFTPLSAKAQPKKNDRIFNLRQATSSGGLGAFVATGNFSANVSVGDGMGSLGSFSVVGNYSGKLLAGSIKTVVVTGTLGGTPSMRGTVTAATSIGTVTAASMKSVDIFAGVSGSVLPTTTAGFTAAPSSIKQVSLSAKKPVFSDVNIAARSVGTVTLLGVTTTNTTTFGLAATSVASYTRGKTALAKVKKVGVFDSAGRFSAAIVG